MKILLSALFALPLLVGSGAALADHGHGHDHGYGHDRGHDRHDHDEGWHGHRHHHWERGHRYDGRVVVIHDYERVRLRPPPRGYHWVRDDNNDYVLVAIATGIILDYVLN
ncbi:MAG TPA: RcnB family protein [Frateuria sp.]|uniref:RcnB family protein n=1 Tax=Frateuria sp. TaxID=2211372 RepID=UPI002D7FD436|nr:RcnB family protein [Frateuria sp.]HET6804692.1 RcnB family protein [Frateuria sp.]